MAKERYINTKFWSDSFVVKLDIDARYLFLYLLTNEHTEICGIYELPIEVMERETGMPKDRLEQALHSLGTDGRVVVVSGWVALKNFAKHQKNNPSVKMGVDRVLKTIPPEILAKIKEKQQTVPRL